MRDVQSKARTFFIFSGPEKHIKNPALIFLADAFAIILDINQYRSSTFTRRYFYKRFMIGYSLLELYGVGNNVVQNDFQTHLVLNNFLALKRRIVNDYFMKAIQVS